MGSPRYELASSGLVLKGKPKQFADFFKKTPVAGCLEIVSGKIRVKLWHLPEIRSSLWSRGLLFDGPANQLTNYLALPLIGQFDIIFVDGRARVSCLKRIKRDKLLKTDGWLFAHDAFRSELAEGLRLFCSDFTLIRGSNRMINGQIRAELGFGQPLIQAGDSIDNLKSEIMQELFVYQNK